MITVNIGVEFSTRLINRDQFQGDGKETAIEFRNRFLRDLDNKEVWETAAQFIVLDFSKVEKIGPSFANEVFAYFTKYLDKANKGYILEKIKLENISKVKKSIVEEEIESGYSR